MRLVISGLIFSIGWPFFANAEVPTSKVKAISRDGITYSPITEPAPSNCAPRPGEECGNRVYLEAKKGVVSKWKTELYFNQWNADIQPEVQIILLVSLRFKDKNLLELSDDKGTHYLVRSEDGKLMTPSSPKIYPAFD